VNLKNVSTGIMSALLPCTGGAMLIINAAHAGGFSRVELISWMFAVYVLGGLLNLGLTIKYKIPFGGAHSITAVAFLITITAQFSIHELVGGYILSGIIIALLGLSGLFNKVLQFIPKPFIDALLTGLILNNVVKILPALKEIPLIGGLAILGFIIVHRWFKSIPPFMGVLGFGLFGLFVSNDFPIMQHTAFSLPQVITPDFSMKALISIAIPVSVLILSNDVAVGLSALKSNGYEPPVRKTLAVTGIVSAIAGLFAGHATNIGGMMSALCSGDEAGPREKRVWAAIVSGVLVILFGLFAWKVIDFIEILPAAFVVLITGFSLLGVLLNSVQSAFSASSYRYSVLFTFIIAISNLSFFGISAPVWALVVGVLSAKLFKEGNETI
jgi:benzoate membrane transport protein